MSDECQRYASRSKYWNRIESVYPYFKKAQLLNFLQHARRKVDIVDLSHMACSCSMLIRASSIEVVGGDEENTGSPSQ